jgi:hypothetical protein
MLPLSAKRMEIDCVEDPMQWSEVIMIDRTEEVPKAVLLPIDRVHWQSTSLLFCRSNKMMTITDLL